MYIYTYMYIHMYTYMYVYTTFATAAPAALRTWPGRALLTCRRKRYPAPAPRPWE